MGPISTSSESTVTAEIEVADPELIVRLSGPNGSHLRAVAQEYGVQIGVRGHTLLVKGLEPTVLEAQRGLAQVVAQLAQGQEFSKRDLIRAVRTMREDPEATLSEFMGPILVSPRKTLVAKGVAQHRYIRAIEAHDVTFGIGPAGTGKTYLAMAMAVRALTEGAVKRIIMTRPAVEAGERLGFLPGDLAEKVNPYLRPLYDALHDMMDFERVQVLMGRGAVEVAPLAFMRGRTLNDSFVILDEAQNSTSEQMKMFLTRLGLGSKAVVTGDVTQTDLPEGKSSGLSDARDLLAHVEGVAVCTFSQRDVVRHPLVARIVRAYEQREAARAARAGDENTAERAGDENTAERAGDENTAERASAEAHDADAERERGGD